MNNKQNIYYFEGSSMRSLHDTMDVWQKEHGKRFLSMSINKEGGSFNCIALTNPTEVIILDGSAAGGAAVSAIEGVNHLAARPQKSCFPASAKVSTPTGIKQISNLNPGDMVLSYKSDGSTTTRPITRKLVHGDSQICSVHLNDGTKMKATSNHTVLTSRGWLSINNLKQGDRIIQLDGEIGVVKISNEQTLEPVYNLYTAGEHTFIVDGVVVHNFTILRTLRTLIHQYLFDPISSSGFYTEKVKTTIS